MKKCLHDNLAGTQNGGRKVKDQRKESLSSQFVLCPSHATAETRCRKWSLQWASGMASKINESEVIVYVCH